MQASISAPSLWARRSSASGRRSMRSLGVDAYGVNLREASPGDLSS